MKMLDAIILKNRQKHNCRISVKDFDEVLNDKDYKLISKGLVDFDNGVATLYQFNYKKECRILIWDNR